MLPIANSYPPGQTNPVTLRTSAVLLGAATWDVTPLIVPSTGFDIVTFFFAYTRGAAVGGFDWYIEGSPYAVDVTAPLSSWFCQTLYAAGVLAAGVDTQSRIQREYITYTATGAAIESFMYGPLRFIGTIERLRLFARESTAIAVGTLQVMATFMKEG